MSKFWFKIKPDIAESNPLGAFYSISKEGLAAAVERLQKFQKQF